MATEAKKIKLSERVEVIGTGKSAFMPSGEKFKVHPELAKKLIKQGKAKKEA
jgi:hypothetical protein